MAYAADRSAAFMRKAPPAEELYRLRMRLEDQQRLLRVVAMNACQILREGGVADRIQLADLLDQCVDEIGALIQEPKP